MNVDCVIVTYNRLSLLKECITAVKAQTSPVHRIYVIDNNSTDGTFEFLENFALDSQVKVISLTENIGGAGGFARGIKEAVIAGADWVWVMDDDTIPYDDALEKMLRAIDLTQDVGYVCSKVLWTDGTPHRMNVPGYFIGKQKETLNNAFSNGDTPAFLIQHASFVSLLINGGAVKRVGLPISEFFIWGDDIEYTMRISSSGYIGFYVDNSIVLHKTPTNYQPYPDTAPANTAWKFYYHARNTTYLKRRKTKNRLCFLFSIINKYRVYIRRINKRKSNDKLIFKKHVRKGCWDGLTFNPQIEYLKIE